MLARPIANEMTKGLGQPVLLEYKPGAGSTIAAEFIRAMNVPEVKKQIESSGYQVIVSSKAVIRRPARPTSAG